MIGMCVTAIMVSVGVTSMMSLCEEMMVMDVCAGKQSCVCVLREKTMMSVCSVMTVIVSGKQQ